MASILLALGVGIGIGICLQKGRFCFVHAFRDLIALKDTRVTKGVLAATVVTMVLWSVASVAGYGPSLTGGSWGLVGLLGGFLFGVGMTYAGGCATGTLFRVGEGYVHFWVTLCAMGVGYVIFVLLFPTLESAVFQRLTIGTDISLFGSVPLPEPIVALLVACGVVLVYATLVGREADTALRADGGTTVDQPQVGNPTLVGLIRFFDGTRSYLRGFGRIDDPIAASKRPWDPRTAGLGITVLALVWFVEVSTLGVSGSEARWTGLVLQQAGVDVSQYEYWGSILFHGEAAHVTTDMVMVAAIVLGAFLAAVWSGDFAIRTPKRQRLPNAIVGGLLMGGAARIAGCNIALVYSGLASLSLHAVTGTIGILCGVYVTTHWLYRDVGCAL